MLADVIAMVVDVTTTQGVCVSWQMLKPNVADGITTGQHFFKLSSEMLSRTSSHICGRWYLPMFLFRDGLLTLMYRASFMVLMRFWSSLPNMEKLSIVTAWPEMLRWSCIGEGAFRCSLNLSSKFLADSPIYSSSNPPCMTPTFFRDWIFILWRHEEVFDGMTSFKMYFNPIFLASSLEAFTQPLMVRYNSVWFWSSGVAGLCIVDVSLVILLFQGWWLAPQLTQTSIYTGVAIMQLHQSTAW